LNRFEFVKAREHFVVLAACMIVIAYEGRTLAEEEDQPGIETFSPPWAPSPVLRLALATPVDRCRLITAGSSSLVLPPSIPTHCAA